MLGIVLEPLGLPLDAVLVLFIAIDPIIDPCRTLTIVHSAIMSTSLMADLSPQKTSQPPSKKLVFNDIFK